MSAARMLTPPILGRVAVPTVRALRDTLGLRRTFASVAPRPAYTFDIDGVLIRGPTVLPKARDALQHIVARGDTPFAFVTNGGGMMEEDKAKQLSGWLDIQVRPEQVVLSHTPMRELVPMHGGKEVLVVGSARCLDVARQYGFEKAVHIEEFAERHQFLYKNKKYQTEPAHTDMGVKHHFDAVLCMSDPSHWGLDLQVLTDVLRSTGTVGELAADGQPVKLYFSNPDFMYACRFEHPRFGAGAFNECLAHLFNKVTGRRLEYTEYGKPNTAPYVMAEKTLREQATKMGVDVSSIYMVGDNPRSDIDGANRMGGIWRSALVRTGVYDGREELPPALVPWRVFDDVGHVIQDTIEGGKQR